mgnify:CR=1 FL=1
MDNLQIKINSTINYMKYMQIYAECDRRLTMRVSGIHCPLACPLPYRIASAGRTLILTVTLLEDACSRH